MAEQSTASITSKTVQIDVHAVNRASADEADWRRNQMLILHDRVVKLERENAALAERLGALQGKPEGANDGD